MYEIKLFYCILQNKKKLIEYLRVVTPPPLPPPPSIAGTCTCTYLQCLSELFYRDRGKGGLTSNQNHRFLGLGDEFYTLLNYKNNISLCYISNILEKKCETCKKKKIIIYFFSDTLVHILYVRVHVSVHSLFTQYPSTRIGKFKFPKIHLPVLKLHVINKEQK